MRFDRFLIVGCALAVLIGCGGGGGGGGNNGPLVFMVTDDERLISFDSATPGNIESNDPITGLAGGESILGMDFRGNGELYALGSTGQLYVIDLDLAAAVPVGAGVTHSLAGVTDAGFDFNPVVDRIRVVTDGDLNFRVNPNTGDAVDGDVVDPGIQPDVDINPNTSWIRSVAYSPINAGATTLFGIDVDDGVLVRIGGIGGSPSPNLGTRTDVGPVGVSTVGVNASFDISEEGTAFMADSDGGTTLLYTVNLTTGAATLVGTVGGSHSAVAMAVRS
jgi:hypothetical protein